MRAASSASRSPTEHRSFSRTRPSKSAHARIVGPNGVGKSTVLRLLAGRHPTVDPSPSIRQGRRSPICRGGRRTCGETLRERLARLTGVSTAERALEHAAAALAGSARDNAVVNHHKRCPTGTTRRCRASSRSAAGTSTPARPRPGAARAVRRPRPAVHGPLGRRSRARGARRGAARPRGHPAARRADERPRRAGARAAEAFVEGFPVRSCRLARPGVPRPDDATHREIDPRSHAIVEWAGGWSDFERRRDEARAQRVP